MQHHYWAAAIHPICDSAYVPPAVSDCSFCRSSPSPAGIWDDGNRCPKELKSTILRALFVLHLRRTPRCLSVSLNLVYEVSPPSAGAKNTTRKTQTGFLLRLLFLFYFSRNCWVHQSPDAGCTGLALATEPETAVKCLRKMLLQAKMWFSGVLFLLFILPH